MTKRKFYDLEQMSKAIFTTKVSPSYDDRPEEYYHFPSTYLRQVRSAIGDHIIYYEPRRSSADDSSRGGRQAYFATARVENVVEDQTREGHLEGCANDIRALCADLADGRNFPRCRDGTAGDVVARPRGTSQRHVEVIENIFLATLPLLRYPSFNLPQLNPVP